MRIPAFVLAMFAFSCISAQDFTFKVLISKGQNQVKAGERWLPLSAGAILNAGDLLKIPPNGYLGLVHVSGKPLEVREPGNHKVADLSAKIKDGAGVLHKYTDFILSRTDVKRNNLTATGSVNRGRDDIHVFLPRSKNAVVFSDDVIFVWTQAEGTPEYVVRLNSMFGDELEKVMVRDSAVAINLAGTKLRDEDNILVEVSSKDHPNKKSEPLMLKKLSSGDKVRLSRELAQLPVEQTALDQLYLATFFEDRLLLIDASTAYQRAIKLAPDVPYFQQAYRAFLVRNSLVKSD